MKTENKIIKLFIENKKPKTIREISKAIKSDYRITHTAVKRLIFEGAIVSERVGNSLLCRLNNSFYGPKIYLAEDQRREKIFRNRDLRQLYQAVISKIGTVNFILILFGSYAKNKQTKSSDIDLMFILNDKSREERIRNILSLLPLKIHALIFTEDEFLRMKEAKKSNVVQEAIKSNIILYGIEAFYFLKR